MTTPSTAAELKNLYASESSRLEQQFLATADGLSIVQERTILVESIVRSAWENAGFDGSSRHSLIAVGDFGRCLLFPHSEIDLLFIHESNSPSESFEAAIQRFSQGIAPLNLKWNMTSKGLAQVEQLGQDNIEWIISLLDCRQIAGDAALFANLRDKVIPEIVAHDSQALVERLAEGARARYRKFGHTVFHLEPNVKESPGGYLDYTLARTLALLSAMEAHRCWPEPESIFPESSRSALDSALRHLVSVRCFLHFRRGRDDNALSWNAQGDAARRAIGAQGCNMETAADWMRIYYGHARDVYRIAARFLEEMPAAQTLFYRQMETWRTGFSGSDFSVVDGLIFLQRKDNLADEPALLLRLFRLIAERGFKLSPEAERQIETLPPLMRQAFNGPEIWNFLQEILQGAHAAEALRAMHSLHFLTMFLPELRGIDALAVRDFSHRFTVDEHTLQAIENLRGLRLSKSKWDVRYAEILDEIEQPEMLDLAILLHDAGKTSLAESHIAASLAIAQGCFDRFELPLAERDAVIFLIEHHLDMSATLRRDIFDPQTIAQFAENVGTPDRLKMLCLFTYADIKAVSPEALTPWKAEDLWQLYIAAANYMDRSVDERVHADADDEVVIHLRTLAQAAGKKLQTFLEGLPRRYLRTHPVDEILRHLEMSSRLGQDPVQLALKRSRHWYELTIVTRDRPFLFASVAGALAAYGMNIGKAGAFSNDSGTVVDTFYFTDRFRTLEMNLPKWERFKSNVHAVLSGKQDVERMIRERLHSEKATGANASGPTQIQFDDLCSAHSTLAEIITQDQPGLLYRICSIFARLNCNIDIALIDTEAQTAIDVFYLTSGGGKLAAEQQEALRQALVEELSST